jgi:hypothetical protein
MTVIELDLLGVADVGVVPGKAVTNAVVSPLDEGAEMGCERAAGEQAHLLHRKVVVGGEAWRRAARLRRLEMREPGLQRDRKRRTLPVAAAQRVAAELEAAAERRSRKAVWQVAQGSPVCRA